MEDKLNDVARVQVRPGDRFVIRHPDRLSSEAQRFIRHSAAKALGVEPERVLLLDGGLDLAVVGAEDGRRVADLLEANTRSHNRIVALSAALAASAAQFRDYERLHRAKGTDEGDAKAIRNAVMAEKLEGVLADRDPPTGVNLKEAGPVAAGGASRVGAFVHSHFDRITTHLPNFDGPDLEENDKGLREAVDAVLRDFVAFAAEQLKARAQGHPPGARVFVDVTDTPARPGLKLVADRDGDGTT